MVYIHSAHFTNKRLLKKELNHIYGIGDSTSQRIRARIQLNPRTRVVQLSSSIIEKITYIINESGTAPQFSGTLFGEEGKRIEKKNIYRFIKINSYRGFRHTDGYPCRGQRTHTNGKTSKKKKIKRQISPTR
jgi:small subunit ribosomal protein S13